MYKVTKTIKPQEFSKVIAAHGGEDNAMTSYDFTA
jgi:predicted Zn-dependent peptidase